MTDVAVAVHGLLRERGQTVATAESLTGGLVGAALSELPGSSTVFRGGVIVYATDLKASLAGVSEDLLAEVGPVSPGVAGALAAGVRSRLGADWGIGITGVAGPDPQDDKPVGTVHVGVAGTGEPVVASLALSGDRDDIRRKSVRAALTLLRDVLTERG